MGIEEQFILLALGVAFIGVRVVVRWRQVGPSNWELDDYLMPLVGVSLAAHFRSRNPQHFEVRLAGVAGARTAGECEDCN